MYVIREILELSYPDIGVVFGFRDHTSVIWSLRKVKERKELYVQAKYWIAVLKDKFK